MLPAYDIAWLPLWIAPLALLVAAALAALDAWGVARGKGEASGKAGPTRAANVGLFSALAALAALVPSLPAALGGATVLSHAVRWVRVGSLDVTLGFALDRAGAVLALGVIASLVAAFALAPVRLATSRHVAVVLGTGAAALGAVLADGFPTLVLGLALACLLPGLASDSDEGHARRFALAGAGAALLALGTMTLFWALGGRWLDDARYLSDFKARFVVLSSAEPVAQSERLVQRPGAKGSFTIVSHPGSLIYVGVADEAQLARSEPVAVSPAIRQELVAGLHKIAIAPGDAATVGGDGLEVALVDTLAIREDQETVIGLAGPTVTFHEIAWQTRDEAALVGRRLARMRVVDIAAAAFFAALSCWALSMRRAVAGPFGALLGALVFAAGAALVARVGAVLALAPAVALVFAVAAAGGAAALALRDRRGNAAATAAGPWAPLFACIGAIAVATTAAAPLAAASVVGALGLAAAGLTADPEVSPSAPAKGGRKPKKRKTAAASPPAADAKPAAGDGRRRFALLSALTGVPLPALGVFALPMSGIACALAATGALPALLTASIAAAWAASVLVAWRRRDHVAGQATAAAEVTAVLALAAGPAGAFVLVPWRTQATVAADFRVGASLAVFALVALVWLRFRNASAPPPSPPVAAATVGVERRGSLRAAARAADTLLSAPMGLVAWIASVPWRPKRQEDAS